MHILVGGGSVLVVIGCGNFSVTLQYGILSIKVSVPSVGGK